MRPGLEAESLRVAAHELVDAVGGDRLSEDAGRVVAHRPEQRPFPLVSMSRRFQIFVHQPDGARMQRDIADLAALAGDPEMRNAPALVTKVADRQLAECLTAQG